MTRIILIETSTALCSTALAEDGQITARREDASRQHSSLTAPFIQEMLAERGLRVRDCDAVCVSMGPGSYTGLRVGVSTAKGLCFGARIPLLAVGSLDVLACQARGEGLLPEGCRAIVPMIDARRMEVYSAVYAPDGTRLSEVVPTVVDASSFAEPLAEGTVLFIGDGADKCRSVLTHPNARFVQACPKADWLLPKATEAFSAGRFQDLAYFEPFYLKDFIATTPKKLF